MPMQASSKEQEKTWGLKYENLRKTGGGGYHSTVERNPKQPPGISFENPANNGI